MELSKKLKDKIEARLLTKVELSEMLGISRVTLDTRLEKGNWKKTEKYLLQKLI